MSGSFKPTVRKGPISAEFASPGPAHYKLPPLVGHNDHAPNKVRGPSKTIARRLSVDYVNRTTPGPKYDIKHGFNNRGMQPNYGFQLSGRLPDIKKYQTPAPNHYPMDRLIVPPHHRTGPAYSLGRAHKPPRQLEPIPGPKYNIPGTVGANLPNYPTQRMCSLKGRGEFQLANNTSQYPGPGHYPINDRHQYKSTAAPMLCRIETKRRDSGPGPGSAYDSGLIHKRDPSFYMGTRHSKFKSEFMTDKDREGGPIF